MVCGRVRESGTTDCVCNRWCVVLEPPCIHGVERKGVCVLCHVVKDDFACASRALKKSAGVGTFQLDMNLKADVNEIRVLRVRNSRVIAAVASSGLRTRGGRFDLINLKDGSRSHFTEFARLLEALQTRPNHPAPTRASVPRTVLPLARNWKKIDLSSIEMAVLFILLASSAAFYAPPIVPSHATTASRTSQPIVMKRWDKRKVRNSPRGQ